MVMAGVKTSLVTDSENEIVLISAPRPNFVAMATTVGPEVQWIADFLQTGAELPSVRPWVATW